MQWVRAIKEWFYRPGPTTILARSIAQLAYSIRLANEPNNLRQFMADQLQGLRDDIANVAAQVEQSNANTDLFIAGLAALNNKLTDLINNPASEAVQLQLQSLRQDVQNISSSLTDQLRENAQAMGLLPVPDTVPENVPGPQTNPPA